MILLASRKNNNMDHLVSDLSAVVPIHTIQIEAGDTEFKEHLKKEITEREETIIINCCQISSIPYCEYNREITYALHSFLTQQIADFSREHDMLMVSFSTAYIFDGNKEGAYTEEDVTNPRSAFADSLLLGERYIQDSGCRHLIIRLSHAYGRNVPLFQNISNISEQQRALEIIRDQVLSPTSLSDISRGITALIEKKSEGTYHLANSGSPTVRDFIDYIITWQKESRKDAEEYTINEVDYDDYRFPVDMPINSALDSTKYSEAVGHSPRAWQDAMKDFLERNPDTLTPHSSK